VAGWLPNPSEAVAQTNRVVTDSQPAMASSQHPAVIFGSQRRNDGVQSQSWRTRSPPGHERRGTTGVKPQTISGAPTLYYKGTAHDVTFAERWNGTG